MHRDLLKSHISNRKLTTLVENRTTYNCDYAELNIFETHQKAEKVSLTFDHPVVASMISGKKIMHLDGLESFNFFPGESVVMPKNETMIIDFPIAKEGSPTQCLALGIDESKVSEVVDKFNFDVEIENQNNDWSISKEASHLQNNVAIDNLLDRLVFTFTHNCNSKDVLLDLMIQELLIRLLQTNAQENLIGKNAYLFSDTRIGFVLNYINENLTDKNLTIDQLASKACMSTSHFHKKFKNTLGVSPIDYINSQKIKYSKKLIQESKDFKIADIAFKSGFNNVSYFNRQFKKNELMTPQQFKSQMNLI